MVWARLLAYATGAINREPGHAEVAKELPIQTEVEAGTISVEAHANSHSRGSHKRRVVIAHTISDRTSRTGSRPRRMDQRLW